MVFLRLISAYYQVNGNAVGAAASGGRSLGGILGRHSVVAFGVGVGAALGVVFVTSTLRLAAIFD